MGGMTGFRSANETARSANWNPPSNRQELLSGADAVNGATPKLWGNQQWRQVPQGKGYGGNFGSGQLNAVNFGSKPIDPPPLDDSGKPSSGPANRRAEMWGYLKKALEGAHFSLPDRDSIQSELTGPG
jgi:hypothetical protein